MVTTPDSSHRDNSADSPSTAAASVAVPATELLNVYTGEITIRVDELPALQPQVIPTRSDNRWQRFIAAGRRRSFTLARGFEMEVSGNAVPGNLSGTLVIPVKAKGVINVFDGASIPLPWVVSYASFGVLRPLGILLAASVVHDFAFQYGYLPVRRDGRTRDVPVERHDADELFRLITATLNRSRFFSRLAWHAVRLGWWFLPYAGQKRSGEVPLKSTVMAGVAVLAGLFVAGVVRATWLDNLGPLQSLVSLAGLVVMIVAVVYLWIAVEQRRRS